MLQKYQSIYRTSVFFSLGFSVFSKEVFLLVPGCSASSYIIELCYLISLRCSSYVRFLSPESCIWVHNPEHTVDHDRNKIPGQRCVKSPPEDHHTQSDCTSGSVFCFFTRLCYNIAAKFHLLIYNWLSINSGHFCTCLLQFFPPWCFYAPLFSLCLFHISFCF